MLILTKNCEIKVRYARVCRKEMFSLGYGDVLDANGIEDPGFKYNRAPAGVSLNKSADPPNTFVPSYRLQLELVNRHRVTRLTATLPSRCTIRCRWQYSKRSPRSLRHRRRLRSRSHRPMRLRDPTTWGKIHTETELKEKQLQFPTQCTAREDGRYVLNARMCDRLCAKTMHVKHT